MNANKKLSRKVKKPGNRKELEFLFENCKNRSMKGDVSFCENGFLCKTLISEGECSLMIEYAKTHTLGGLK